MLYCGNLRFSCDICVHGHRARDCQHFDRIYEGLVYVVQDRGRPSRNRASNPSVERVRLVRAALDPDNNLRCPKTGKFKFECATRCCGNIKSTAVNLLKDSLELVKVINGVEVTGNPQEALPKSSGLNPEKVQKKYRRKDSYQYFDASDPRIVKLYGRTKQPKNLNLVKIPEDIMSNYDGLLSSDEISALENYTKDDSPVVPLKSSSSNPKTKSSVESTDSATSQYGLLSSQNIVTLNESSDIDPFAVHRKFAENDTWTFDNEPFSTGFSSAGSFSITEKPFYNNW